jgi:hypothetical protein
MTLQRMDNVGIVVEDLDAAIAFFTQLGMEREGSAQIDGLWADRAVGLDGVRSVIAMMRTPDGHSKLELTKYHIPRRSAPDRLTRRSTLWACIVSCSPSTTSMTPSPTCAPTVPNSSARWRSTRTAAGSATCVAPRASSSPWPNRSANAPWRATCDQPKRSAGWTENDNRRNNRATERDRRSFEPTDQS